MQKNLEWLKWCGAETANGLTGTHPQTETDIAIAWKQAMVEGRRTIIAHTESEVKQMTNEKILKLTLVAIGIVVLVKFAVRGV